MTAPIISEAVFNKMDRNKDGFVSKGNIVMCVLNTSFKLIVLEL